MFHEEKVIDGFLVWRSTPNGEWLLISPKIMTDKILELEKRVRELTAVLNA